MRFWIIFGSIFSNLDLVFSNFGEWDFVRENPLLPNVYVYIPARRDVACNVSENAICKPMRRSTLRLYEVDHVMCPMMAGDAPMVRLYNCGYIPYHPDLCYIDYAHAHP